MEDSLKKSEILFLYETSYNIPNGDPFTGEQRYDEETNKILVSDVRIKRYVRTYLEETEKLPIYVSEKTGAGKTDAKGVLTWIANNQKDFLKISDGDEKTDIGEILKSLVDVRLFGGISTLKENDLKKIKINGNECTNGHVQFTGPVQFALLNPSLNNVILRMHQSTTHFTSSSENSQGSIVTTTVVPYSLIQIHGWVNPSVAETTGMTQKDLELMYKGLWYGTGGEGSSHSRSKIGQDSILLLEIIYKERKYKVYRLNKLIKLVPKGEKKEEEIRDFEDYDLDFSRLIEISKSDKIEKIKYYTEIDSIKEALTEDKFEFMTL